MQIVVSSISAPYQDGKTTKIDMNFSRDGKDTTRKLARVGDSVKAFDVMRDAKRGEVYEIELVQSADQKFWNWVGAKKVEGQAAAAATPQAVSKSTYETAEERKVRQLYIARQACIGYAVNLLGSKATSAAVLKQAQEFVDFVYGAQVTAPEAENGDEDFTQ